MTARTGAMKNIVTILGSNSQHSINGKLLETVLSLLPNEWLLSRYSLVSLWLPLYGIDREQSDGFPAEVVQLGEKLSVADGLVIASPEHNGSIPAALKNLIDWLSRAVGKKFLGNTDVLLLSTSPGPNGGATNLQHLAKLIPFWGGKVVSQFSLGSFHKTFDLENGVIRDVDAKSAAELALRTFVDAVLEAS